MWVSMDMYHDVLLFQHVIALESFEPGSLAACLDEKARASLLASQTVASPSKTETLVTGDQQLGIWKDEGR